MSIEELYPSSRIDLITKTAKNYIFGISVPSKQQKMAIKVRKGTFSLPMSIQSIENELNVCQKITHHAFRESIAKTTYQNREATLFNWETGYPISEVKKFCMEDFMMIGREVVSALSTMHHKKIIHMSLTCDHIIFNPETKSIKIIGTSSSTGFSCQKKYFSASEHFDYDLSYISPEQTSLVNRAIDFRSDFYSLGIVLYKMLAGKFPFESDDTMSLMHMHLLLDPPPISSADNIPKPILSMISKLLEKQAQDRYQSSKGILHDLDLMISEYNDDNELTAIKLASHDMSEALLLPQTLFGRSSEFKTLLSVFDRMSENSSELAFVAASSGAGKTALVSELHTFVVRKGGIFTSGKYDSSYSVPYFAMIEAIKNFCNIILLKDKLTIAQYRSRIQHAVGDEGKLVTSLIPNLHLLIGNQPDIVNANGHETKHRFNYVFINFIQAACSVSNPLVFILDDLQWIDPESENLLRLLIRRRIRNLMLIGVYRDNEIDNLHPVSHLLRYVDEEKIDTTVIKLQNLNQEDVNNLISCTLHISPLKSYDLTALIFEKTKGNPFFVVQTLKSLYDQNLLYFCQDNLRWKWKHSLLSEKDFSGNVLELLTQRILSLDKPTQEALKVASCLGSPFSLSTLKLIVGRTKSVESMVQTGIVLQHKGSKDLYSFVHDKMKQASSSLLPKIPKNKDHVFLYIGKKLWKHYSKNKLDENIFEVVNLLSQAKEIVKDEECIKMSRLFLKAGLKAANLAAFDQAYKYLKLAVQLQVTECWKTHYEERLKLFNAIAESAYCNGDCLNLQKYNSEIEQHAISDLDLTHSYCLRIKMHNDRREYNDAINIGICMLKKIGENIDFSNYDLLSKVKYQDAIALISNITEQDILSIKKMEEKVPLLLMLVYDNILTSAYFTNPPLKTLIISQMVNLTFAHGICKYSCGALLFLASSLNKKDGTRFRVGNLAFFALHKRIKAKEVLPKLHNVFYYFISPFHETIHAAPQPFIESYQISNEVGLIDLAAISAGSYASVAFLSGKSLHKLAEDMKELDEQLQVKSLLFKAVLQSIVNLVDEECKNPGILNGTAFDYRCCFSQNTFCVEASYGLIQCVIMAYLCHEYETALKIIKEHSKIIKCNHSVCYTYFIFYKGLVALHFTKDNVQQNVEWKSSAEESMCILKDLSETAPMNFSNKYHLLKAEKAACNRNEIEATMHFKRSVSLSGIHGFTHEKALACERAGIFFLSLNNTQQASQYFSQAHKLYQIWGARRKSKQLLSKYSDFVDISKPHPDHYDAIISSDSQTCVSTLTEYSCSALNSRQKRVRFST